MRLVCLGCGRTTDLPDTTIVAGMPLAEWFNSRGQLCQDCHGRLGLPAVVQPTLKGASIQQRFEEFHRLNPWVYEQLRELALELVNAGRARIGIRMLYEVLRWKYAMTTRDPSSEFKLNDHYHSRYVRLLVDENPELADKFELRQLKAA